MPTDYAVVGAGFSGAVLARELAEAGLRPVRVFEVRPHIGGNCHTERDADSGVMVHRYGPHIFHTSRRDVWEYVQQFGEFVPYLNRVKAITSRGVFSLPINLLTLNQFFGRQMDPAEARRFLASLGDPGIVEPKNFEEQALKMVGPDLYTCFFRDYTKKQWGVDPRELPAGILQRLPIRCNYDDTYYSDPWQAIPAEGYTALIGRILDHPHIHLELCQEMSRDRRERFRWVFWTGPLDAWFEHCLGRLRYRTLDFEWIRGEGDMQGNPVLNYCQAEVPWTRSSEHKHFLPREALERSILCREYSRECGAEDIPFYPLRLEADRARLEGYEALAGQERGVSFLGRLGRYRYLDMDTCIADAREVARRFILERAL